MPAHSEMPNSANLLDDLALEVSGFPSVSFLNDVELSDGLLEGSIKSAAVIACSDMGWLVPYVCSSANVQLFLFQNFGHSFATGGFVETVVGRGVERAVVYGHSASEYTKYFARSVVDQPAQHILQSPESKSRLQLYSAALESDSETLWEQVGRYNVLSELKGMLADPVIGPVAAEGKLKIHGWFYKSAESLLEVFDPKHQAFIGQRTKLPDSLVMKFVPDEIHARDD
jgi:carbonic anhydrase